LRPERTFLASVREAFRKGLRAAAHNLPSILVLQAAMGAVVAIYYLWPAGAAVLSGYAHWQASGGFLGNGLAAALAGGVLSEISVVYIQNHGRWTWAHLEHLAFKFALFFITGCMVFEFYRLQAYWWGQGTSLSVIVPKVIVDQFGYTVILATPYFSLLTRWYALRYSGSLLWRELDRHFLTERMLPILVMNWMFWIPAISFVYAMPGVLQPPLYVFATAIWGLLVATLGRQESSGDSEHGASVPARPSLEDDTAEAPLELQPPA
jgi:hypothetical protein